LSQLRTVLAELQEEKICADDCLSLQDSSLVKVEVLVKRQLNRLSSESRTARLWIQYLYWIDLVKCFIMAERTSNWHLHLETTASMLPLFAAAGHQNYARCARLYL